MACLAAAPLAGAAHGGIAVWDGGGDGASWHDPLNWVADALPASSDDVIVTNAAESIEVIHSSGATVINSLTLHETLTISGGSITINADSQSQGNLRFTGGALAGAGDLTVSSGISFSSGSMSGPGRTILTGSATLTISTGGSTFMLDRRLDHGGTMNWAGGNVALGAPLTVLSNGKINVNGNGSIIDAGGEAGESGGSVTNTGRITKNNNSSFTIQTALVSSGLVQAFGGTLAMTGGFTQTGTTTTVTGTLSVPGGFTIEGGIVHGTGEIIGDVWSPHGTVEPGDPVGILTITGDYTQGNEGELRVELAGPAAGSGYDRLSVSGAATLDGDLRMLFANGYEPSPGASFTVLTAGAVRGAFDQVSSCGLMDVNYAAANVSATLLAYIVGDIDCDGDVDGGDLAQLLGAWSIPPGSPGCGGEPGEPCPADLNDDGQVNAGDLAILLGNWG